MFCFGVLFNFTCSLDNYPNFGINGPCNMLFLEIIKVFFFVHFISLYHPKLILHDINAILDIQILNEFKIRERDIIKASKVEYSNCKILF
jgi:hypothetical protein